MNPSDIPGDIKLEEISYDKNRLDNNDQDLSANKLNEEFKPVLDEKKGGNRCNIPFRILSKFFIKINDLKGKKKSE